MPPVTAPLCHFLRGGSAAVLGVLALIGSPAGALPGPESAAPPTPAADLSYRPPEDGRALLAVDEPMRRFFSARVDPRQSDGERLRQIAEAIVRPEGLHFAYEAAGTYDACEAFRRRRGSCVTFAFLLVAVAREYGLDVRFQEFETYQRWNRFDRFLAAIRHTNVRMSTHGKVFVADLRPDLAPVSLSDTRYVVSDERAFAHFYSTAGFFRLVGGDSAGALRLMNLGAAADPQSKIVWANLGNVHAMRGELGPARACLEQSLRLDSRGELALVCLVDVLRRQGGAAELKLAEKYERRARDLRLRNPYYQHQLAAEAQAAGDGKAAELHLRRAIRLKDDEPVFREELVELLRRLGRTEDARREEDRLAGLRAALARLRAGLQEQGR